MTFFQSRFVQGFSLAIGIVGVTGVLVYRDALIKVMGGHTQAEIRELRDAFSDRSPNYTFNRLRNITREDCVNALDQTVKNHVSEYSFWSSNLTDSDRRGLSYTVYDRDGLRAEGTLACHFKRLFGGEGGEFAIIMSALYSPFDDFEAAEVEDAMYDRFRSMFPSDAIAGLPDVLDFQVSSMGTPAFTYNCERSLAVRFESRLGELQSTTHEIDIGSLLLDGGYDPVCNYEVQERDSDANSQQAIGEP